MTSNGTTALTTEELTVVSRLKEGTPNSQRPTASSEQGKIQQINLNYKNLKVKLGSRYAKCTSQNYQISDDPAVAVKQKAAIEKLKSYNKNMQQHVESGEGVVLFGKHGTGKDHLLTVLAIHAVKQGYSVLLEKGMNIYRGVTETWGTASKESDRLKELTSPDILIISDPIPPGTSKLKDHENTFLYSVVDERYCNLKPTWVTANFFGLEDAENKISSQVIDRMKDGALTLYFDWPSYRKAGEWQ